MKPEELLKILNTAGKLKVNTRHNWTEKDRKESVADHSWRLALMAGSGISESGYEPGDPDVSDP